MTRRHGFTLACLCFAVLVAPIGFGCGASSSDGNDSVGSLDVPPFPFAERNGIRIDEALLTESATRHCRARGGEPSAVRLLLDDLPFDSVDAFCAEPQVCEQCEEGMGSLYLSGYFGGLWLRDALDDVPVATGFEAARLAFEPPSGFDASVLASLANSADRVLTLARSGSDEQVIAEARDGVPFLLALFGYNRGYLERALESPPPGQTPLDPLQCTSLLGCSREGRELELLRRYRDVVSQLDSPPDARWQEMARLVTEIGESTVSSGREVWDGILSDSAIAPEAYEPLADVSAGYLLVSEAALLASMQGFAESDAAAARCGLIVRAGLVMWSGSYFQGLASSAAPGTFPSLTCSDP